jgi:hypothetical protein
MIYLDASVVFSLHFRDSNTIEALHLVGAATEPLLVSAFCEMETINAFVYASSVAKCQSAIWTMR